MAQPLFCLIHPFRSRPDLSRSWLAGYDEDCRVAELLSQKLGQEAHGEVDPDLCVALGAAVQAGVEMGAVAESVLVDITPYTFGTSALGELGGKEYPYKFVPLIRRNTKLPARHTEVFYTVYDDQEVVDVNVYQGEDIDALKNVCIAPSV